MQHNNFVLQDDSSGAGSGSRILVSLLVAADEKNVIGLKNQLPWNLPGDLTYFKNLTWGMPLLMGRKTFESIGKALPGRKNIVITRNHNWHHKDVSVVHSITEATNLARGAGAKEIFVIGGAEIFQQVFSQASRIYLTRIHHQFDGDVYFPELNSAEWTLVQHQLHAADDINPFAYSFQVWERADRNKTANQ